MSVSTKHSAAASAAGFEHQRQLALVLLAEAYLHDPSVKVRLEAVEDIDLVFDANATAHVQVKHHLKDQVLTDFSPELWRTLAIWMEAIEGVPTSGWPRFYIATTAEAKPGSAAALLRQEGRKQDDALSALLAAANKSTDASSRQARDRFRGLDRHLQLALLERTTVLDATLPVAELDTRLRRALAYALPRIQTERFLAGVHGWWVARSVQLLTGGIPFVSGADLQAFGSSLRDQFNSKDLVPHKELVTDPTEDEKEPYRDRRFVQQLKLVNADFDAVDLAIRHYHRAYAQRGRWTRELDDLGNDIEEYETRLRDEWEIAHVAMRNQLTTDEEERAREGLKLATEFGRTATARLRGLDEPVLCHGTLHGLADVLKVGWHPDFRKLFSSEREGP
jgi:hypothetical protein